MQDVKKAFMYTYNLKGGKLHVWGLLGGIILTAIVPFVFPQSTLRDVGLVILAMVAITLSQRFATTYSIVYGKIKEGEL